MARLAEQIADRFIGQQVNMLRLAQSEREQVLTMLGRLQSRVLAKMDQQIPLPGFGTFTQQRLGALYRVTDKLIDQQYTQIMTRHTHTLVEVSGLQSAQTRKIVNAVIGVPLMTVGVPLPTLKALVNDDLVDGRPAGYWWAQQASTLRQEYRDVIRQGAFAGETLGEMKQRVQGTRARNYQDGIMARTGKRAEVLIRTSILSVANAARDVTYRANDDVLDGEQWLATLDDRTCAVCAALDNESWQFDGSPIGETTQAFPGPPPQHFQCRCTLVPIVKSWAQLQREAGQDEALGKKVDELDETLPKGERESMGGPVEGRTTYNDWLGNQDEATQRDILGAKRFALWQQGSIDVQDLVDQQNRPLSLEEILASQDLPGDIHAEALPEPSIGLSATETHALLSSEFKNATGSLRETLEGRQKHIAEQLTASGVTPEQITAWSQDQRGKKFVTDNPRVTASPTFPGTEIRNKWAGTSGDSDPFAIAVQVAAEKEFKLGQDTLTHLNQKEPTRYARAEHLVATHEQVYRQVVRAMYDETQAYLKEKGITEVMVMRGVVANTKLSLPQEGLQSVILQPLSSYTLDPNVAAQFANGRDGFVLLQKVPASQIFGLNPSGTLGTVDEMEIVVLGGRHEAHVVHSRFVQQDTLSKNFTVNLNAIRERVVAKIKELNI